MNTEALRKRLAKLEAQRNGNGWLVVELLLDSHGLGPPMDPDEREAAMAAARKRWPEGVSLEQLLAESYL